MHETTNPVNSSEIVKTSTCMEIKWTDCIKTISKTVNLQQWSYQWYFNERKVKLFATGQCFIGGKRSSRD